MTREPRVIGIDAGATKTVALLANEHGTVLASARGTGANLVIHGELAVEKALHAVIEALDAVEPVEAICIGIAGVDRPGESEVVTSILARLAKGSEITVVNDAHVALVAGAPDGCGIVVVAGTGSISFGVDPSGERARSGGWGYLLGDEGSAFWLGHAALRLGIRAFDGRGPKTLLFDRICERLGLGDAYSLVEWFYGKENARIRVAELASLVEVCANEGDAPATALLDQAAGHLCRAAEAVERELAFDQNYALVLAGGAFKACPSLVSRFERFLNSPKAQVVPLECEPAQGAVRLALAQLRQRYPRLASL